jgi:phosphoglycolate phosphatase-like HAD superfamily hydrolase
MQKAQREALTLLRGEGCRIVGVDHGGSHDVVVFLDHYGVEHRFTVSRTAKLNRWTMTLRRAQLRRMLKGGHA